MGDSAKVPPKYPDRVLNFATLPPTGQTIHEFYTKGECSSWTPCGVSDYNRHRRELQAVTMSKFIAVDHTMDAVKTHNKKQLKGAKAIFDVATKTGEIALAVLLFQTPKLRELPMLWNRWLEDPISIQWQCIWTHGPTKRPFGSWSLENSSKQVWAYPLHASNSPCHETGTCQLQNSKAEAEQGSMSMGIQWL